MDLSTAERARVLLMGGGIDAGTALSSDASAALAQLLTGVSAACEGVMDRHAESGVSRTEYFDVYPGQRVFSLRAYPVASVTSVHFDPEQSFGSETALTVATDYANPALDVNGFLILKTTLDAMTDYPLPRALKVIYTGGMAASAAAFVTAFPDIAGAVDRQVIYEWKRRNDAGVVSVSDASGTVTIPELHLLRATREVLARHRRINVA